MKGIIIAVMMVFGGCLPTLCQEHPVASQAPMRLWYDHEAQFFEESLPIGNGKLGALVYGGAEDNLIYLNDITLWTGNPVDRNLDADAHQWIPKIREALFNEDYQLADSLQHYVQGPNSQFYQPLGTLHIYDWNQGDIRDYRRELDVDSAVCRATASPLQGNTLPRTLTSSSPYGLRPVSHKPSTAV